MWSKRLKKGENLCHCVYSYVCLFVCLFVCVCVHFMYIGWGGGYAHTVDVMQVHICSVKCYQIL